MFVKSHMQPSIPITGLRLAVVNAWPNTIHLGARVFFALGRHGQQRMICVDRKLHLNLEVLFAICIGNKRNH